MREGCFGAARPSFQQRHRLVSRLALNKVWQQMITCVWCISLLSAAYACTANRSYWRLGPSLESSADTRCSCILLEYAYVCPWERVTPSTIRKHRIWCAVDRCSTYVGGRTCKELIIYRPLVSRTLYDEGIFGRCWIRRRGVPLYWSK